MRTAQCFAVRMSVNAAMHCILRQNGDYDMKNALKQYFSLFFVAVFLICAMPLFATAAPTVQVIKTTDGFLYAEAENAWTNNLTTYFDKDETRYFGGKAVMFDVENKTWPTQKEDPDIELKFKTDIAGTYSIWMRHYAETANASGQNGFVSYNGADWTYLNYTGTPDSAKWMQLTSVELEAGEVYDLRIRSRQKYYIAIDTFVITADPMFTPNDLVPRPLKDGEKAQGSEKTENAIVLCTNSPNALVNGERVRIDEENSHLAPYIDGDTTMVPLRFIAESLGATVEYREEDEAIDICYGENEIHYQIGSVSALINGEETTLAVAPKTEEGRTLIPLRATAEAFGKQVFWDENGLIILSDEANIYQTDGSDDNMIQYLLEQVAYERPSAKQVEKDLRRNIAVGEHPRLMANQATFDRIKNDIQTDARMAWLFETLKDATDQTLDLTETLDKIEEYKEDGPPYDTTLAARYIYKLRDFSFLWKITGDEKYAEKTWTLLDNLCDMKNWCPGAFLLCSETMAHVAIAYDWCYDYLSTIDGALEKVETALYEKGVMAGVTAYEGATDNVLDDNVFQRNGWRYATSNWNHISNSGCGIAAIALMDLYPEECSGLISNTLVSVELANENYAPDGGYQEGPSYWAYGTNYISYYMMALDHAMGTTYGILSEPGMAQTCYYRPYVTGTDENPSVPGVLRQWNYHDSGSGLISSGMYMWYAAKLKDANIAGLRYREIQSIVDAEVSPTTYGFETANPYDLIYYDKDIFTDQINLPLDRYFEGIETVFMRSDWNDPNGIYTGLHAGKNNVNHGQMDAGNFIIEANGKRWFTDLGMDNYELPEYFWRGQSSGRYNYYRSRAEGHNTLVINPDKNADQQYNSDSPIIRYESLNSGCIAVADLSPAYGANRVTKATRGLMFTDQRSAIIVQDEVTMPKASEFYWFATTMMDKNITLSADGKTAILENEGDRMCVRLLCDDPNAKFTVMPATKLPTSPEKHELERDNSAFQKLTVHLNGVDKVNMAVVFQMLEPGQEMPEYDYEYVPIDEWELENE